MTSLPAEASATQAGAPAVAPLGLRPILAASLRAPLASVAVAIAVLLLWQFVPPALGVPKFIIPRVSDLVTEMGRLWANEDLLLHITSTASMAVAGFAVGGLLGAVFG